MHFLGGVQSREVAWRSLCRMAGAWTIRGYSMFSVILRNTGSWIGRIGTHQPEGWPGTEIGWGIARAFAGKGYAHEAAVATMDYAVDVPGWADVIHTIDPDVDYYGPTSVIPAQAGIHIGELHGSNRTVGVYGFPPSRE